jgi:energy-coupling factor transporter ATP-binding protein EcfA2
MKILYVRAKGYIGIYQGTGLEEIYIDFRRGKNRIVMIDARNGGGKSTLLDLLNPFPDPTDEILKGKAGEKEIAYEHRGSTYIINIDYPVTMSGERAQTRAYIKKQTENGNIEYNPTGNITTFKDVLDTEFGLDPNFISLSRISTEDKGLVDKKPTERKKFVNKIIDQVEVYNNILKVLNKRSSSFKSLINNITSKIDAIGDEEGLIQTLKSLDNRIYNLKGKRDVLIKNMSEAEAMIKVLDPDLSIQNTYTSIQVELESIDAQIKQYNSNIEYLVSKGIENLLTSEEYSTLFASNTTEINKYNTLIMQLESSINDMLVSREEENRAIQLKVQRLNSLKSEFNFADIQKSIRLYETNIEKYEEFFNNIHIKNAIAISKDEYVSGLHTLKDIKDMVDGFRSYSDNQVILDSVDYIRTNANLVAIQAENNRKLDGLISNLEGLTNQNFYYNGLLEKVNILVNRPKNCKIDDCSFIKDSLDAFEKKPKENLAIIESQIRECNRDIDKYEKESDKISKCLSCINDINITLRNIRNNSAILNKLPNGYIFSNTEEFLNRLYNNDKFEDIDELYKYIDYANIFEEYKIAKDTLYKLQADYKIYESKNEVIEELSKDISNINEKLSNISSKLEAVYSTIDNYKIERDRLTKLQEDLSTMISIFKKREELEFKQSDNLSKLNAISSNMEKIQQYINAININNAELIKINEEITPMEDDRDKIKYGLNMLKQYNEELASFTESYNTIDVLKLYSNPNKKGIQNLFIKVYMSNTLGLANQLLSYLFNGRMKLLPYNIGEGDEFYIPCVSMNTGMLTDDIYSCSRSEKSMISMILGFVLLRQSSTVYNILKLDEIDEGLDTENRLMFINTLNRLLDLLEVEQCIMVSHSSELTGEVDIIRLEQTANSISSSDGNVIFSLAA